MSSNPRRDAADAGLGWRGGGVSSARSAERGGRCADLAGGARPAGDGAAASLRPSRERSSPGSKRV